MRRYTILWWLWYIVIGGPLRLPLGYEGQHPPELKRQGSDYASCCPHCFLVPCITEQPPTFLQGSSAPYPRNWQHRFRLYRSFWRTLKDLGVWTDPRYLRRKRTKTTEDDVREVMPMCIVKVSSKWNALNKIEVRVYLLFFRKWGKDTPILQEWHTRIFLPPIGLMKSKQRTSLYTYECIQLRLVICTW